MPTIKKGSLAQAPERNKIQTRRFSFSTVDVASKPIVVERGEGEKLKNLEYVATEINRRSGRDQVLSILHRVLFGHLPVSGTLCKETLLKFSGIPVPEESDTKEGRRKIVKKYRSRIEDMRMSILRDMCRVCNIDQQGEREEVVKRLVQFLIKPKESGLVPAAREEKKSKAKSPKKSKATKHSVTAKEAGVKRPTTGFFFYTAEARPGVAKKHPKETATQIAKRLGKKWRKMSDQEKKPYKKKAEEDKARYEKEMAAYEAKHEKRHKHKKHHKSSSSSSSESGSESDSKKDKSKKDKSKKGKESDEEKETDDKAKEDAKREDAKKDEKPTEPDSKKRRGEKEVASKD